MTRARCYGPAGRRQRAARSVIQVVAPAGSAGGAPTMTSSVTPAHLVGMAPGPQA